MLLRRILLTMAVVIGLSQARVSHAAVDFIDPTINLQLPTINFDANINPIPGQLSSDALNIIRAHRVALQQVQAAIQYLRVHRADILAGQNAFYNQTFGDFYDVNSPFAGQYNRVLRRDTGKIDQFKQPIYEEVYNTAHYDRVLYVFLQIQAALQDTINYAWGAQTGNAANSAVFDTYRNGTLTVGDPLFGSPTQADYFTPVPIDPLTGLPAIDPDTMLPVVNPPLLGDPMVSHFSVPVTDTDRGQLKWRYSTSFTPKHLDQIATDPANPLRWDADNDISTETVPLTPEQELAFFKDRLDTYAVIDETTGQTIYVGGAFLNEEQRADSGLTGQPNIYFHPTELKQYQQIIEALAQSAGSQADGTNAAVSIESGIKELFGPSAYFFEALDAQSYAEFVDLFKPVQEGGIGDGSLLPPPGKQAGRGLFSPLVPAS